MRIPKNWLTFRLHYFSSIFMTPFSFMQSKQLKQNSHYVSVHDIYGCGCILFFQFHVIPLEIEKNLWNWTCLGTRLLQRHKNNNNNSIAIWWILFHLRLMLRINKKNQKKIHQPTFSIDVWASLAHRKSTHMLENQMYSKFVILWTKWSWKPLSMS